jgi:RNA polymerase nonessential primary-like sigma factor
MKTSQTSTDLVRTYLREIGRVPLLTHEQEILFGKQVQRLATLNSVRDALALELGYAPAFSEWAQRAKLSEVELHQEIEDGESAKLKMVEANLRLVVSVAKKTCWI